MSQYNIGAHVKTQHGLDPVQYKLDTGITVIDTPHDKALRMVRKNRAPAVISQLTVERDSGIIEEFVVHCKMNKVKYDIALVVVMFEYHDFDNVNSYIDKYTEIMAFDGIRGFSYEWFKLTRGETYAKEAMLTSSERVSGELNPAFDHGGRLSPFSRKFTKYENMTDAEADAEIAKVYASEGYQNREFSTTIEYWRDRTDSDEAAQRALTERQTTFSLDKCIEEYGEEDGHALWKDRQERWQSTLNAKSPEELNRINKLKSHGKGYGGYLTKPGTCDRESIVYYLRFFMVDKPIETVFWKVGITSTGSVERRFCSTHVMKEKYSGLTYEVVETAKFNTLVDAFDCEQRILKTYDAARVRVDVNGFKTTEAFSADVLDGTSVTQFATNLNIKEECSEVSIFDFAA